MNGALQPVFQLLWLLLYLFLLAVLSFAILTGIGVLLALVGALLSVPLLYALPDVRRFVAVATDPSDGAVVAPWRLVARWRFLLAAAGFGVAYSILFVVLWTRAQDAGVTSAVGPWPTAVGVVCVFVLFAVAVATLLHQRSTAWDATTSTRSVVVQWTVFLTCVVGLGTAVPVLVTWL